MNARVEAEGKRKRSPYIALVGLAIAVVLGIVAWAVAPSVLEALAVALPAFNGNELPLTTTRPIFTAIIVLLTVIVFGLVAAMVTPKDTQTAREGKLEKERDALRRRQKAERMERRKR